MIQYKGETEDGQELLLTVFEDGTTEVATRRFPWETWSPAVEMVLVTSDGQPLAATAQETRAAKA